MKGLRTMQSRLRDCEDMDTNSGNRDILNDYVGVKFARISNYDLGCVEPPKTSVQLILGNLLHNKKLNKR